MGEPLADNIRSAPSLVLRGERWYHRVQSPSRQDDNTTGVYTNYFLMPVCTLLEMLEGPLAHRVCHNLLWIYLYLQIDWHANRWSFFCAFILLKYGTVHDAEWLLASTREVAAFQCQMRE